MTRAPITRRAARQAREFYAPDGEMTPPKPRAKARDIEGPIHRAIKKWLEIVLPPDCFVDHIPGAPRNHIAGARLKSLGATAGMPDFMIIVPARHLGEKADSRTFFIEVKSPDGKLSKEQIAVIGRLERSGAYVAVARSVDEARDALRKWGIRTTEIGNFAPTWRTPHDAG